MERRFFLKFFALPWFPRWKAQPAQPGYTDDLGTDPALLAAALTDRNKETGIDYGV